MLESQLQDRSVRKHIYPWTHYVMVQWSGDGWSIDDLLTSQSIEGESFLDFAMLDAKIASALEKECWRTASSEIQSILEKEANCLYDPWPLSVNQSSWYSSWPVGFVQYLRTRWGRPRFRYKMDQILLGTTQIPLEIVLEGCVQDEQITRICSGSHSVLASVRPRNGVEIE